VKTWTEIAYQQHRLLKLLALLSHSLEKNCSEEMYRKTKLALHEGTKRLILALQRAIPSLTFAQWVEFLKFHQALVAGLWPMTQYSDMQRQVLDDLALSDFNIDFAALYEKALLMYLRGVIEENIRKTSAVKPEPEPAFQLSPEIERGLEQIDDIHEMVSTYGRFSRHLDLSRNQSVIPNPPMDFDEEISYCVFLPLEYKSIAP
jgi:hypothetical protein